jgi:hypothetical protein
MVCKINLHVNNTGIIDKINWHDINEEVEFNFVWLHNGKSKNAKNIIIYHGFSKCLLILHPDETIKKIKFINNNINLDIIIKSNFLIGLNQLKEVDFSELPNIKRIEGHMFLTYCENLININLNPLKNIECIGHYFLSGCIRIKSIDLSALKNITHIPGNFLSNCYELREIDLSPLKNVIYI